MKKPDSFGIWEELNLRRRRFFTPFSFTTLIPSFSLLGLPPRSPSSVTLLGLPPSSPATIQCHNQTQRLSELYQKLNIVPAKKWRTGNRKPIWAGYWRHWPQRSMCANVKMFISVFRMRFCHFSPLENDNTPPSDWIPATSVNCIASEWTWTPMITIFQSGCYFVIQVK